MFSKRNMSKVTVRGFLISMAVAFGCVLLYMLGPAFLSTIEMKSLDLRFLMRGSRDPGNQVVIVAVDEKSIKALGRWQQWSRSTFADLLKKLDAAGARVVAFDLIYSEAEKGLTSQQADELSEVVAGYPELERFVAGSVSGDEVLRGALKGREKTLLPLVPDVPVGTFPREMAPAAAPPEFVEDAAYRLMKGDVSEYPYIEASELGYPIRALGEAATSMGHIYAYLDHDGSMRWEAMAVGYDGAYYPPLGLAAAREYLGLKPDDMVLDFGNCIRLGDITIPTDEHGRMLINYCGPEHTFSYYSLSDVLDGNFDENTFKDKVVLVGATALGLYDLRVTPFSANMPGVEKHANVIENVLGRNFMVWRESTKLADMLVMLGIGIVLGLVLPRMGSSYGAAVALSFMLAGWAACYVAFSWYGLWLDMTYPTMAVLLIYVSVTSYSFLAEENKSRDIKRIFSSYVTPKVVDQLTKNPELAKLGGERKEITVMFSDVRGFTTFSESRSPEEVVARLNEYMGAMTDIIFKWDGTVDKFVGDEIMAFWGAPLPQDDQAERAVLCSIEMVKSLRKMQERWASEGKAILDMGIGINTGDMVVGNMGAEGKKMDYTIIGDSVNLGARVETLTRNYEAHIIITEYTYKKIMDRARPGYQPLTSQDFKELDSVRVKGKERPVTIFKVNV